MTFDQWLQTEAHPHLRDAGPLGTEWLRAIFEAGQRNAASRSPENEAEQFIQAAIDRAPEPLRRLGEYLTSVLDDEEWRTAEPMLLGAAEQPAQGEAVARKYAPDYPEHDCMSCSDAEPFNATPAGSHGCARCTALVMDGAALPAPSVPGAMTPSPHHGEYSSGYVNGWNACRAAMLAAASPEVKP